MYYFQKAINFTGTLRLYYQPAELNGNVAYLLKSYDSADLRLWLESTTSTANAGSYYVQLTASSHIFNAFTAANDLSILPLSWISFNGQLEQNDARLTWTVNQNEALSNFVIEESYNGQNWQDLSTVISISDIGQYTYSFIDHDINYTKKFYRIKMVAYSGETSYSSIVEISRSNPSNSIRVISAGSSVHINFVGDMPSRIRVINTLGQIILSDNVSRNEYEVATLPGIYFIQYELNGILHTKEFAIK